jgi:hypothetical protein
MINTYAFVQLEIDSKNIEEDKNIWTLVQLKTYYIAIYIDYIWVSPSTLVVNM